MRRGHQSNKIQPGRGLATAGGIYLPLGIPSVIDTAASALGQASDKTCTYVTAVPRLLQMLNCSPPPSLWLRSECTSFLCSRTQDWLPHLSCGKLAWILFCSFSPSLVTSAGPSWKTHVLTLAFWFLAAAPRRWFPPLVTVPVSLRVFV